MDMNAAKNQRESFESAVTSHDSFIIGFGRIDYDGRDGQR